MATGSGVSPMAFDFRAGNIPLLVSIPHNGSEIPDPVARTMTEDGRSSRDTDWFLDRLYDFPELSDASRIVAKLSRYVIDLNRPSDNQSLYPGQTTTGLVPLTCFDGAPIYSADPPGESEIGRRVREIWQPYHAQIAQELQRMVKTHGKAVLIEAHSIASRVPRLFDGVLPDFNFGTSQGQSCDAGLTRQMLAVLEAQSRYSHVLNGRFVGGWITRHFGNPGQHVHAIQIELSQATYLDEMNLQWDERRAEEVRPVFRQLVSAAIEWTEQT